MKNKVLLSGLVSVAVLSLTACGGGSSTVEPEVDSIAPVISMNNGDVTIVEGTSYIDSGATATDNVDTTVEVQTTGAVNSNVAGTYKITYSATDAAGNEATEETRTVKVTREASFNDFDGTWEIACQETTNANLNALGITRLFKRIEINQQDISARVKGYRTTDCSGVDSVSLPFKGTAYGKATYLGENVTNICRGEKVDINLDYAHFNGGEDIYDGDILRDYADKIGLALHNTLCIDGNGALLEGDLSGTSDGASDSSRPEAFNPEGYTKQP